MIDGWRSQEIKLEHLHSVSRKQMDRIPLLCIGHSCTDPEQSSQTLTLSSLMILEGSTYKMKACYNVMNDNLGTDYKLPSFNLESKIVSIAFYQ